MPAYSHLRRPVLLGGHSRLVFVFVIIIFCFFQLVFSCRGRSFEGLKNRGVWYRACSIADTQTPLPRNDWIADARTCATAAAPGGGGAAGWCLQWFRCCIYRGCRSRERPSVFFCFFLFFFHRNSEQGRNATHMRYFPPYRTLFCSSIRWMPVVC